MSFDHETFPELPKSWVSITVEDACINISIRDKILTKSYLLKGDLAVVDQGYMLVGGFTDQIEKSVNTELPVIIFGDHTRAIKFVDFPFAAGADGIKILNPNPYFVPKLFYWFLKAIKLPDKGYARHFQYLRTSRIALPPLNEQKRIADKLDRLLAKVDACRERFDRIPLILKRFRQSVLAAATSGELTEDWREQQNLRNEDWQRVLLGSIVNEIRNGISAKPDENPLGVSILRISSVRPFNVNFDDHRRLSSKAALDIYLLKSDDLLFTRYNGTLEFVGVCARIQYLPSDPVVYPDKIIRVRVDENLVVSGFIEIATNSPSSRKTIEGLAKTSAGQTGISEKDLKSLQILLPTLQEQNEIVRRVEKLFAFADRLESRYQTARAKCDQLTPVLLEKAFEGELVPQDPNDEPASVLLERIKAQQAKAEANKPKRTTAKRKAKIG